MKLKTSLLALAATGAFVGTSYSQTVIDITGSSAGRTAVHTQILSLLTDETFGWEGGSATSSNYAIYKGTFGGESVIIRTRYTGSAAGVRDVSTAAQLAGTFLVTSTNTSAGTTAAGVVVPRTLAAASAETVAEIAFSDVFQSSTAFTATPLVQEVAVGVIPFKFFKNKGAAAGLTNMTPGAFRYLYGSRGNAPLSIFTGIATDTSKVYSTGRDNTSGTRITTLAETGAGVLAGQNQYNGTVSGTVGTLTFVNGAAGQSGANIAALLAAETLSLNGSTLTGASLVGYLGASEWSTAVANGATELTYNGVAHSDARIKNGTYTYWGYLQQSCMDLSLTPVADSFFTALADGLTTAPGTGLILLGEMNVGRDADGSPIYPN